MGCSDAGLSGYVGEGAVAVIVKDQVSRRPELIRVTIGAITRAPVAAIDVLAEIPIEIARHNEIQVAIAIVVHEAGAGGPSAAR